MHILALDTGTLDQGSEAIDLNLDPADCLVLSAADSELTLIARAYDRLPEGKPSLRLANLMALGHNLSVDQFIERTAERSPLIVVRLLGGRGYWPYGVDELTALASRTGAKLVLLPGGRDLDPALTGLSTVSPDVVETLRRYLAEGGPDNAGNFLRFCAHLLGRGAEPPAPASLPRAGRYDWPSRAAPGAQTAAILFYRSLIEGDLTAPIDRLAEAVERRGLRALPLYVSSLKETESAHLLKEALSETPPAVILNTTGFAATGFEGGGANPLARFDCPVIQAILSGSSEVAWAESTRGLSARDLAMNVVLPELDGRMIGTAISFKDASERHGATKAAIVTYRPVESRVEAITELAANWARLRTTPTGERRVAIILANYPNRDGRIGNGVGYDTPASTIAILNALAGAGYAVGGHPSSGNQLIDALLAGPTNRDRATPRRSIATLSGEDYRLFLASLPQSARQSLASRWGEPEDDPFFHYGAFHLPAMIHGKVVVAIQPARGYNIDPKATYHDPGLVPPHGYLAFYLWLRQSFGAHAVIHNGKHGNLEWLPGKAVALGPDCWPELALGPMPQLYPFIVNDPGEGTQAKRRTAAVIIDHLTPPLSRAETYGPLQALETLIDEYYLAQGVDQRRTARLREEILTLSKSSGIDQDAGIGAAAADDKALQQLDAWLCDVKESQIRNGLHVLGTAPEGVLATDLIVALTRLPRGEGQGGDQSLIRALARDLDLGFEPLAASLADPWDGPRPTVLAALDAAPWRSAGDTVERLEALACRVVDKSLTPPGPASVAVMEMIDAKVRPALAASARAEIDGVLRGLDGRFVPPGPSGAPTRGRLDVLPTGRNFYAIDNRAVPTPTAYDLGRRSAEAMLERHFQDHGRFPAAIGLSVWGTSNMRTGGDDIAQAMALIGTRPKWETGSGRVVGFEILPLALLGRPRVDVTLRISGFFRDAFPLQIELFDKAVRAVGALDEAAEDSPIAARMASERAMLMASGLAQEDAVRLAGHRIFGSKPGTYGAGLQALIDERLWTERDDFARVYIDWGGHAYGGARHGEASTETFRRRLAGIEAVVHNQDNREHDLLDSDDYYQFEGGMTAAVEHASGQRPAVWHNDHSRPERPVPRSLEEEVGRVMRARVVNPKWIAGVMRHGYKGAFEIAATVDYMFAFAATTGAVKPHHFDLAYEAFIADPAVRQFLTDNNRAALSEIADRFSEALERRLWLPRSNSAFAELQRLREGVST